jgi:hypothetical protein
MPPTSKKTVSKAKKSDMMVTIKNVDNGLSMSVPIGDVINSTYADVASLKKDQFEMKEQLISNSKSLNEIKNSILNVSNDLKSIGENLSKKTVDIENKQKDDIEEIKKNMPKTFATWISEKAKTADAITKVVKISIVIFVVAWTIVSGIPGLFNLLKTLGVKM